MKTILITGASAGLGKRTAEKLLEEGYTVYAACHHHRRQNPPQSETMAWRQAVRQADSEPAKVECDID